MSLVFPMRSVSPRSATRRRLVEGPRARKPLESRVFNNIGARTTVLRTIRFEKPARPSGPLNGPARSVNATLTTFGVIARESASSRRRPLASLT